MLVGEPPFTGPNAQAVIAKRFSGEVPRVRHVRPSVSEGVEQAITRALAPVAADRFPTAAEFVRALQTTVPAPTAMPTVPVSMTAGEASRRAPARGGRTRRRVSVAATVLAVAFIGFGVLFGWRRSHPNLGETDGAKVLAVLPFENLGDSADAYFADGVANDIRTKLSQIQGLQVIARGSSNEYERTTKTEQQIAQELGVQYLLTATVQWEKVAGGSSRVRVTPELVHVRPGRAPQTRWGRPFDAALTSVFEVQADIAGQVAQALHVALGDSVKRELAMKPTQSLPAYDAFLRGEAAFRGGATGPQGARQAVAAYEQAVALDSTFVTAWARLAQARAVQFFQGPTPALAEAARQAAERTRALAPTRSEGHQALGAYYGMVLGDYGRALTEDSTAFALSPGNAELLGYAAWDEFTLGRWKEARRHFEQAVRLDPRVGLPAGGLSLVLLYTRQYRDAAQFIDHRLGLEPTRLSLRQMGVLAALGQGDLAAAHAIVKAAPKEVDPTDLVSYMAGADDLFWALDEPHQQLLLRLQPSAFEDNRGIWGLVLAQTYALRGDSVQARVYAEEARREFKSQLRDNPQSAQRHAWLGLALAYLSRRGEAIGEGQRAVALMPTAKDAQWGPYLEHQLARIYVLVGEPEKALDQLERVLNTPYYVSRAWLKIDPNFASLRGNPRFERLVNGT
jgi:serine/threonine-protein kinase